MLRLYSLVETIMGCEFSKCLAAKHKRAASKKSINKLLKLGLRPEEAEHVFKLLLKEQRFAPTYAIRDAWTNLLTPKLMDLYEQYLAKHSDTTKYGEDTVDIVTYSTFLTNFVKGTVEDKVNLYAEFLDMKDESVLIEQITKYSSELMKSVFKTMCVKKVTQYLQWLERGNECTDDMINRWTRATIYNTYTPDETKDACISLDLMNKWMTLNTDVTWLQSYLFYCLYELEKLSTHKNGYQKGVPCPLPFLDFGPTRDDWRAIVDMPSVIFINSHIPSENRYQWRLAYSVDIHGEGFATLHSSICNRGPTILVIKDKDDHVFGGYASTSWHVGPQFFGDQRCFLFSLRPVMKIFPTLPFNDHFLYLNANQKALPNGLGMGGQLEYWGLWIDASLEYGRCSPSCSTYDGYTMLSGKPNFEIAGLEVWCAEKNMTDYEDASVYNTVNSNSLKKGLEEASILHKDPTARAIIDMLGKTQTGRDFLDTQ